MRLKSANGEEVPARPLWARCWPSTTFLPGSARGWPGPPAVRPRRQLRPRGAGSRGPGSLLPAWSQRAPAPALPSPLGGPALFWVVSTPPPPLTAAWLPGQLEGRAEPVGAAPQTRATAAMSGRSVPHAHPATAEYEFANPSRLGEQRFGEGMGWVPPGASHPHLLKFWADFPKLLAPAPLGLN